MKVEASVDVGSNLASLLERLAQQIGTTADKVFPWYVEQAYLQGITNGAALFISLAATSVLFVVAVRKAEWKYGEPQNAWGVGSIIFGACLVISVVGTFLCGPQQVRKVINPNFYAMQMLAEDIGKMRGGK